MTVLARIALIVSASVVVLAVAGCSTLSLLFEPADGIGDREVVAGDGGSPGGDSYPDVLAVELRSQGERWYDVAVTLSSPYDTAARYADGWRVLAPDGTVLGTHTLMHDHASEQPFTRVQSAVAIPAGVDEVTVQGRDQANGFGGLTLTVEVPA